MHAHIFEMNLECLKTIWECLSIKKYISNNFLRDFKFKEKRNRLEKESRCKVFVRSPNHSTKYIEIQHDQSENNNQGHAKSLFQNII
mmetsp:Transcript_25814/g.29745  ORF Transcript_25814/g.29745 Transcript_25814/m.29745 type:complete len:87 (+) Transcript_25814:24-284(+)